MNTNSLERFVEAQERSYETALAEIRGGKKRTHWMWYIFPQLRGLGSSFMAHTYGIEDLAEAKAYMAHPVLSARLIEISEAILAVEGKRANEILDYTDAIKLRSCMTLFAAISEEGSVFHRVLDRYYEGSMDKLTLSRIGFE